MSVDRKGTFVLSQRPFLTEAIEDLLVIGRCPQMIAWIEANPDHPEEIELGSGNQTAVVLAAGVVTADYLWGGGPGESASAAEVLEEIHRVSSSYPTAPEEVAGSGGPAQREQPPADSRDQKDSGS